MSAEPDESLLVTRLRQRHPGAFDEVYRRHRERVWRFVRQLSQRHDVSEELFQETWVAAARHAHQLREDTRLLPWLLTIARNKHRTAARLRVFDERRRTGVAAEPMDQPPLPDAQADQRRRARRVAAAFEELPEAYREVLLLCAIEGLETDEVGRILDLRPEAVRKRLSRAREELLRKTEGVPMMNDDELLAAIAGLPTPELPPELEKRVHALARSEQAPPASHGVLPLRLALSGAMVPSLLGTVAAVHTAETVDVAAKIYKPEAE